MNREEVQKILENLAGQLAPLKSAPSGLSIFEGPDSELGYSQLNELLLLFGFDRVTHAFFRFLLDGKTEYEPGQAFRSEAKLSEGVDRFRELAILLFGNVKFAFKSLSRDEKKLIDVLISTVPIPEDAFSSRHKPFLPLDDISADDAYLTGYLIEKELRESLRTDPTNVKLLADEEQRKSVVAKATANQVAYLASDHLDVYVATSMRERHEFSAIKHLTSEIFSSREVANLNLRWFDPTQAYCPDRVDKGLSEALMLRRANCTIYLAQESDTLGKDSELASTLAQGKPVVAFIPEVTDSYINSHLSGLEEAYRTKTSIDILLSQLQIFDSASAWGDSKVRGWCNDPSSANESEVRDRLVASMRNHYDKRAMTLRDTHPLGIQVNLQTGVANGVLVVRNAKNCARLIRNIVLHSLEFTLEESEGRLALREKISGCIFRVMTKDGMLTNTFWNFYLDPVE